MENFTFKGSGLKGLVVSLGLVFFTSVNLNAQTTDRTTITKHTTVEPIIDGVLDPVWAKADSALIDATGSHWGPELSNPDDFVAIVKTLWKDNNLYALIRETDDELKRTNAWAGGDYYQISMDVNNQDATDYLTSGHFWAIRPGWDKIDSFFGRQPGQMNGMPWTPADIEFFSIVDSIETGGYWTYYTTLEIKFPLKDLGLLNDLADGTVVGLDFYIQDLDTDGTSVWCYDGNSGWDKPVSNGSFIMSSEEVATSTKNKLDASTTVVYPNPVSDKLTISSSQGFKLITISDMLGKTAISVKFDHSNKQTIDLSALRSGIYFVKAVSTENTITTRKVIKR